MRGNQSIAIVCIGLSGSIPACAGEPRRLLIRDLQNKVYPRVCGGTLQIVWTDTKAKGLSPRVRGNLGFGCLPHRL